MILSSSSHPLLIYICSRFSMVFVLQAQSVMFPSRFQGATSLGFLIQFTPLNDSHGMISGLRWICVASGAWGVTTSAGRPSVSVRTGQIAPPTRPSLRHPGSIPPLIEPPARNRHRERVQFCFGCKIQQEGMPLY
ncbi:hypothetical protein L6452_18046 [Arctium lappa]|uniref:Uncharacterized protein n=1 Tax=Arctium lappa TaxID=4217 RepID=A0ACB9C526_ARCLA|nr:hypothetical protein L6452_18046 [Arctium lappa]